MPAAAAAIWALEVARYSPHPLHGEGRIWDETNCYVDLWIEVLHTLGLDPLACLSFTLAVDFEGDQWTFIKPAPGDLLALYGLDVQELNVWRPLVEHTFEQVRLGRLVLAEADAYFLPDTAGTTFHAEHAKTTVAIQAIDVESSQLGYFHNGGYYTLAGADFAGVFRLGPGQAPATVLAPYVEMVKLAACRRLPTEELVRRAVALTRAHLARRPATNPILRYQERFDADLAWLRARGGAPFHGYAFATLRQLGASCELGALFVRWLAEHGQTGIAEAATDLETIATTAKTLLLKVARAVNRDRAADAGPLLTTMAACWSRAMAQLVGRYAATPELVGPVL